MKVVLPSEKIYIAKSKIKNAGRGVFAARPLHNGEIIEACPVIIVPRSDVSNMKRSILIDYYFYFAEDKAKLAIALGFGSLYNHSYTPNATYKKIFKEKLIVFVTIKPIQKHEEITVNYNFGSPNDTRRPMNKGVPVAKQKK